MKRSILIVDDEKNIRSGLAMAMELEGYDTLTSEDGASAWALMGKKDVDLGILKSVMTRSTFFLPIRAQATEPSSAVRVS